MARILWWGDAGCDTGFARVTHQIGDRLALKYGHDMHVLAINHDGDSWPTPMHLWRANRVDQSDTFGMKRIVEVLAEVIPDALVIQHDPFMAMKFLFRNPSDQGMLAARARPILAYMPIDGINQPTNWQKLASGEVFKDLPAVDATSPKPSFHPVAMSRFGQKIIGNGAPLVYHGIDIDLYRPATQRQPLISSTGIAVRTKKDAKRAFGLDPNSFLVLRVDRNSHRKNYADTWKALVPVMKAHKDVIAWFHCQPHEAVELPELFSREPDIRERFHTPARYNSFHGWSEADMAILYNAADVFVSTSWGEGFGLTLGEAAACGVPIVAQNVSSIPEVVGPGGILLEPERLTTALAGMDQWLPNVEAFTEAILKLHSSSGARRDLGRKGRDHVVTSFSWDVAAEKFDQLIRGLPQQTAGSPEVPDA